MKGRRIDDAQAESVLVATAMVTRMRGLLGMRAHERTLLLAPCKGVHTYGMRYPIDLAFVDANGKVLLVRRALGPGNRVTCWQASMALERKHDPLRQWFEPGDAVGLVGIRPSMGKEES